MLAVPPLSRAARVTILLAAGADSLPDPFTNLWSTLIEGSREPQALPGVMLLE